MGRRGVITAARPAATNAAIPATSSAAVNPSGVPPARLTAATLDITAAPVDAPNSWKVLTIPDATPASSTQIHQRGARRPLPHDERRTQCDRDEAGDAVAPLPDSPFASIDDRPDERSRGGGDQKASEHIDTARGRRVDRPGKQDDQRDEHLFRFRMPLCVGIPPAPRARHPCRSASASPRAPRPPTRHPSRPTPLPRATPAVPRRTDRDPRPPREDRRQREHRAMTAGSIMFSNDPLLRSDARRDPGAGVVSDAAGQRYYLFDFQQTPGARPSSPRRPPGLLVKRPRCQTSPPAAARTRRPPTRS